MVSALNIWCITVCIYRCYVEATTKSKPTKIARFKEYMDIASRLGPIDEEVSFSEDEEHDEKLEGEAASAIAVTFVGEGKSDALEEDSDDAPLVSFVIRKRKVRADDSNDLTPTLLLPISHQ